MKISAERLHNLQRAVSDPVNDLRIIRYKRMLSHSSLCVRDLHIDELQDNIMAAVFEALKISPQEQIDD